MATADVVENPAAGGGGGLPTDLTYDTGLKILLLSTSYVGFDVISRVENTDNTNTASRARVEVKTGGTSAGNPGFDWATPGRTSWHAELINTTAGHGRLDFIKGSVRHFSIDPAATSGIGQFLFDPSGNGTDKIGFSDYTVIGPPGVVIDCPVLTAGGHLVLMGDIAGTAGKGLLIQAWNGSAYRTGLQYDNTAGEPTLKLATSAAQKISMFGATGTAQITFGVATAGAVYTATEQAMLQKVYDALRSVGLGT